MNLKERLEKHEKWLNNEEGGERFVCTYREDLRSADLRYADLRYANLRSADLRYADLRSADLRYADLRSANLRSADVICFTHQRDTAYYVGDDKIRIGCECHTISYWLDNYESIGKKNKYTDIQIKAYGKFIEICKDFYDENRLSIEMMNDFEKELENS